MKKVSYYLAKVSCAVCSLILVAAISGCSGKKYGKATNNANANTEVSGQDSKSESQKAKEEDQMEKDRQKLYEMRRQYREMARELDYIPDPRERSRHSDKMQSLNQQIGDLEIYMLQKYGKPF